MVSKAGEYCIFLEADDYLKPNALEILGESIIRYDSQDCVVFGLERVYNGKTPGASSDTDEIRKSNNRQQLFFRSSYINFAQCYYWV